MAVPQPTELWKLTYWYPSNVHKGEDTSEYQVQSHQAGKSLIFESLPNNNKSYIFARLTDEGDALYTGTWYETTSPSGPFKGAQYSGAGQLLINDAANRLEGMWAGAGYNHDTKQMDIYSGKWEIVKL